MARAADSRSPASMATAARLEAIVSRPWGFAAAARFSSRDPRRARRRSASIDHVPNGKTIPSPSAIDTVSGATGISPMNPSAPPSAWPSTAPSAPPSRAARIVVWMAL